MQGGTAGALPAGAVAAARRMRVALARVDPNAFVEFTMRDEEAGTPIRQAPVHEAWQTLVSKHDRLVVWSHTESGKSAQLSVGRVLWELGRDPSLRVVIVSNTHKQGTKISRLLSQYIEQSAELREVFPNLTLGTPWTHGAFNVKGKPKSKDFSVQVIGVHGNIVGARIDLLILDDILDFENTRTPGQREDLWAWLHSALLSRLTLRGRLLCIGTAFHPDDVMHRLGRKVGYSAFRYPAVDETGAPRWPDRWPLERIERARTERGPAEFARQMLCMARDDAEARFKREWIDVALRNGNGAMFVQALPRLPNGARTYTGVDLAVQQHAAADSTALTTIMVLPNGKRQVLCIEAGKWTGPDIVDKIVDHHRRYMSIAIVENVAAQHYIVQFTQKMSSVPVKPFTTGRNKAHPEFGVESLAAEMAGGLWIFPNQNGVMPAELDRLVTEMLYYSPTDHTGDRLMSLWFAREGSRMVTPKAETGRIALGR